MRYCSEHHKSTGATKHAPDATASITVHINAARQFEVSVEPDSVQCSRCISQQQRRTPGLSCRSCFNSAVELWPPSSLVLEQIINIIIIILFAQNTTVCTFARIQFKKSGTARSDMNTNSCPKTVTGCIFYHTNKNITNEKN